MSEQRGQQGVPGEQGVRDNQGIQGVPGTSDHSKGDKGETGRQGKPGKSAHVVLDRRIEVSFWLMLLIFVAVVSFMGYEFKEVRDLAQSHERALEANAEIRRELVQRFNAVNRQLCEGQELLKQQNREDAIRSFRQLDETLELLGIEKSPAIIERATRDRDRKLSVNAPRPGGCQQ